MYGDVLRVIRSNLHCTLFFHFLFNLTRSCAALSRALRRSQHGQILINACCAILCLYLAFVISGFATNVPALCAISAALVHYFMLTYFMWTAAEAVFLYIQLVKVLGNKIKRFSLKAGLISWCKSS